MATDTAATIRIAGIRNPVPLTTLGDCLEHAADHPDGLQKVVIGPDCRAANGAVTVEFYALERVLVLRCAACDGIVTAIRMAPDA